MRKTVVLGVSSGIAAFKSVELVRLLKKEGLRVIVILTRNASFMVNKRELEKESGAKVYKDLFDENFDYKNILKTRKVDHIDIADSADVCVVAPATANTIAKIAQGFADDFLTTTLLATTSPIIICPSMNVHMWENSIVQKNIQTLRSHGAIIIDPEEGQLACGYRGKGRLAHLQKIKQEILAQLNKTESLKGKKILVTTGGTIEKIDDVRFITNKSSGKMGNAISDECLLRGAEVLLVRSKNSVSPKYKTKEIFFETIDDLHKILVSNLKHSDIVFHAAAVSDFTIKNRRGKISSEKEFSLKLTPQKKLLNTMKKINPKIKLVAFKAEWGLTDKEMILLSQKKLKEVSIDAIVANDVSKSDRGFESDSNEVIVILKNGVQKKIPLSSKQMVAKELIDFLIKTHLF